MQNMMEAQFKEQMNRDNQMMNQVWSQEEQKNMGNLIVFMCKIV